MQVDLKKIKKVYFLGIGGIGISAIARMFLLEGKTVFGSDVSESLVTEELRKAGAEITIGQDINLIPEDTDLVVYTIAVPHFHPDFFNEVKMKFEKKQVVSQKDTLMPCPCCASRVISNLGHYEICEVCRWEDDPIQSNEPDYVGGANKESLNKVKNLWFENVGKKVISYPEILEIISKDKYTIAVSGTHGKTTTTAMIAKVMIDAGLDPTVIVGSMMKPYKSNFAPGKSKYLVVEACEYKKSFLNIHPTIAVVTNIEADHLDFYKDIDEIEKSFQEFSTRAEFIVSDFSDERLKSILDNKKAQLLNSSPYFNEELEVGVPGIHNRKNASMALVVADFLNIPKESALKSIKEFSGTWRRFDYKGVMSLHTGEEAIVYDDYAHHPSEIKATIQAMREKYPDKKVVAVFQPHLFSRTKDLFGDFVIELSKADKVILLPIYKARENDDGTISSDMLAEEIKKTNTNVLSLKTFEEVKEELFKSTDKDSVVLVMGAGDISELSESILNFNNIF